MPQRPDRNALAELAVPLALMGGAGWAMWQAGTYGVGSLRMPGAGGYPFILSIGLFLAGAVLAFAPAGRLVRAVRTRGERPTANEAPVDPDARLGLQRAAALVAVLAGWIFLFESVGFVVASVLCSAVVCLIGGLRSPVRAALFACALTAFCYLLFVMALGLPL